MATKTDLLYSSSALARAIGVSADTIKSWSRKGILTPKRTTSGTRIYSEADRRAAQAYRQSRMAL